jgi:hypothetical protein
MIQVEPGWHVTLLNQIIDHALKPHRTPIVGMVDASDAIGMQFFNL